MTDALLQSWRMAILGIVLGGPPLDYAAAHRQQVTREADAGRTVTLRGCLRSWDGTPEGIGRSPESPDAPMQYVLTHVEPAPANSRTEPAPPTATPPSSSGTRVAAHDTYVVEPASATLRLEQHLGREVEVTGTMTVIPPHDASTRNPKREDDFGRPGTPPPPAGESRAGTPGTRATTEATPVTIQRVRVDEVKVIAQTCGR